MCGKDEKIARKEVGFLKGRKNKEMYYWLHKKVNILMPPNYTFTNDQNGFMFCLFYYNKKEKYYKSSKFKLKQDKFYSQGKRTKIPSENSCLIAEIQN